MLELAELAIELTRLFALTVNVYAVLDAKPVRVITSDRLETVFVNPPELLATVKDVGIPPIAFCE
jgi:hypothetical protein